MHPIMAHLLPSVPRQVHRSRYRTRYGSFSIASLFRPLLSQFVSPPSHPPPPAASILVSFLSYSIIQILSRLCRYSTATLSRSLLNNIEVMANPITLDEVYNRTRNRLWLINILRLLFSGFCNCNIRIFFAFLYFNILFFISSFKLS